MPAKTVVDAHGRPMSLGSKIGEGGEGAVYALNGAETVAKIYLQGMPDHQASKINAMVGISNDRLRTETTWPLGLVFEHGKPVGFTMQRLAADARELHDLIGPKARKRYFPKASWRFLIHTGINISAAFETLHANNVVMGDVNSRNIVVRPNAMARLLDSDSFQVRVGTTLYPCQVGVPEFQPPELKGHYSGVERLPQHDLFGLAVVIFQLLFVGKHPFIGVHAGTRTNEAIDENIAKGRFFFAPQAARQGLAPPPGSPNLNAVTPQLAQMFVAAFTGAPAQRPTASVWRSALSDLQQRTTACNANPMHSYLSGTACPWCAIERNGGLSYFVLPVPTTATGAVDVSIWQTFSDDEVDRVWAGIQAITPPPQVDSTIVPGHAYHRASLDAWTTQRAWILSACLVALIAGYVTAWAFREGGFAIGDLALMAVVWFYGRPDVRAEAEERRLKRDALRADYQAAQSRWDENASAAAFSAERKRLSSVVDQLLTQKQRHDNELRKLEQERRQREYERHMDGMIIAHAAVKGIGQVLAARLQVAGFESALDLERGRLYPGRVQGIGEAKCDALNAWVLAVKRSFRFDPNRGLDKAMLAELEGRYARERANNRQMLISGAATLERVRDDILQARSTLESRARVAADQYWQAEKDATIPKAAFRC